MSADDANHQNTELARVMAEMGRAARAADRGELEAILAELTPLIEEKADV
mgnify:CR=1 FL=1